MMYYLVSRVGGNEPPFEIVDSHELELIVEQRFGDRDTGIQSIVSGPHSELDLTAFAEAIAQTIHCQA